MKPHSLSLQAFGPYVEKLTIDFERLGERNLFLISGPTGSGKSSVLDAICYALYGETSGGERQVVEIRSQLAQVDIQTEISFSFSKGEKVYRVVRSPDQQRKKQRGQGVCEQKAQAELVQIVNGQEKPIACRPQQVNPAIRNIIGFDIHQFRQAVVLPQGQFRRFLLADSRQREEILASIFQTDEIQAIQSSLKQTTADSAKKIQELAQHNLASLQEVGVEELVQLDDLLEEIEHTIASLQANLTVLSQQETQYHHERDRLRQIAAQFREFDAAQASLEQFRAQVDTIQIMQAKHAQAIAARAVYDLGAELDRRRKEQKSIRDQLTGVAQLQIEAKSKFAQSQATLDEQKALEPKRETLRQDLRQLKQLLERVTTLQETKKQLEQAQAKHLQAEVCMKEHQDRLQEMRQHIQSLEEMKQALFITAGQRKARQLEKESLERTYSQAVLVADKRNELRQQETLLHRLQAEQFNNQQATDEMSESVDRLTRERLEGQAFALAEKLQPSVACPVCGSTEHPAPPKSHVRIPSQSEIDQKRLELKELQSVQVHLSAEWKAAQTTCSHLRSWLEQNEKELGESISEDLDGLKTNLENSTERLEDCDRALEQIRQLDNKVESQRQHLAEIEQKRERSKHQVHETALELKAAQTVLAQHGFDLEDDLQQAQEVQQRIRAVEEELQAMLDDYEKSQYEMQNAQRHLWELSQQEKTYTETLAKAVQVTQEIQQEFVDRLSQVGFADEKDYEQAQLPPEEIQQMDEQIAHHNLGMQKATDRFERAQQAVLGLTRPDLEEIDLKLARIKTELSGATEALGANQDKLRHLQEKKQAIDKRETEIQKTREYYSLIAELAEVACDRSMTLERFVLASFLDEVLLAASDRLALVSRQRYQLRRDQGQRDRRKAGGLDLVVFDAHTGLERSVASLSGGESFLAALSLALGLADVVQARSGGIHLDTMFVDEGFGSLDPEALEMSLKVLMDINIDGKLIGIISHVPELKDRIEARLEITPSLKGSRAQFVL